MLNVQQRVQHTQSMLHLHMAAWLVCCRQVSRRDTTAVNSVMLLPPLKVLSGGGDAAVAELPVSPAAASVARLARCLKPGASCAARCTLCVCEQAVGGVSETHVGAESFLA